MKAFFEKLGTIGVVLYWIFCIFAFVIPIVAMDFPAWIRTLVIIAAFLFSEIYSTFVSPVFWIWGLVNMINGPQDIVATIYYVSFAIIFLPSFILGIISFIGNIFRR